MADAHHSAEDPAIPRCSVLVPEVYRGLLNAGRPSYEPDQEERPVDVGPIGTTVIPATESRVNHRPCPGPDFEQSFTLQTDDSAQRLGVVLIQHLEGREKVIAYASQTLNPAERNYNATELECLAVVWGIRRMQNYLEGYHFTALIDHQSLRWLQRLEAPTGRLGRWLFELQQYDFEI